MTHNEYQKACMRTASGKYDKYPMLLNGAIGLCGETGETLDILKKHIFQGHDFDETHMTLELGDICWYLAVTAEAAKISLDEIAGTAFYAESMFRWHMQDSMETILLKMLTGLNIYTSKILWYVTSLYLGDIDGAVSLKTLLVEVYKHLELAASAMNVPMNDIYVMNIDKLQKRYPDGFDSEKSLHREKDDI